MERLLVETFEQIRDELVSTLSYVLGNRDDAMDSAQETFVKCWRARETISEVLNLRAWIFRVGLNAARDFQRSGWTKRARPLIAEEVLLPARDSSAAEQIVENESVQRLRQAILELRPEEREVFLLRQNGELTYEQIAEARDMPVGTVKTQMRTALIKLRKVLNPDVETPTDEV
ncbi:RNA polymerase sigma factor [Limnoglobus roseus]|uniref:RNA polymerase sigma factor n=1 Tax=Limnoglobus roseus TaxID=2598579 RepID=UPI001FE396D8|nr:RNA polymerase sigma factor [Limnoglobus roseus]